MTFNVGIIGAGTIGKRLAKVFKENKEVNITHICDIAFDRAKELSETVGGTPCTDFKEIIGDPSVDFVYIGVPPELHNPIALAAIEGGKAVICEKPLAGTNLEGLEMVNAAKSTESITTVNLPFRFSTGFNRLRELISNGELGKIKFIELRFRFPQWPRPWQNVQWLSLKENGGPLREVGTHFLFALLELFGDAARVMGFVEYPDDVHSESKALGLIEMENGVKCTLSLLTPSAEPEENSLTVYGESKTVRFTSWFRLEEIRTSETIVISDVRNSSESEMVNEFVKNFNNKVEYKGVSFLEAYKALKMVNGLFESNGSWIEM